MEFWVLGLAPFPQLLGLGQTIIAVNMRRRSRWSTLSSGSPSWEDETRAKFKGPEYTRLRRALNLRHASWIATAAHIRHVLE